MSYGLFDADLYKYKRIPFPNLELMKLSTYYKGKKEIVSLSPDFLPNRYSNFIIRQDFDGKNYPVFKYNNVEYGGMNFHSKYVPLGDGIDLLIPDTSLYDKVIPDFCNCKKRTKDFNRMMNSEHIRMSFDGETVDSNFEKQLKGEKYSGIILHDYDLNKVVGAREALREVLKYYKPYREGQRIGMKFPVQVSNSEDLLEWLQFKPMSEFYYLQYNGIIDDEVFDEMIRVTGRSSTLVQMIYNITENVEYDYFVNEGIQRIYRQIYFLRSCRRQFSLKYDRNFFLNPMWLKVLKMMTQFMNNGEKIPKEYLTQDTMQKFIRSHKDHKHGHFFGSYSMKEFKEIWDFVKENNYPLLVDFYQYHL